VNPLRTKKLITRNARKILGGDSRSGTYVTDPIDISRGKAWSVQFSLQGGSGTVEVYISSGDKNTWAKIGDTYTLENGTMLRDSVTAYRYVKFAITADQQVDTQAYFTMVI